MLESWLREHLHQAAHHWVATSPELGLPLNFLDLSGCTSVSAEALDSLQYLPRLTHVILKMEVAELTEKVLASLKLLSLESLFLDTNGSEITNTVLESLEGLPLCFLDLACAPVSPSALSHLYGMPLICLVLPYIDPPLAFSDADLEALWDMPLTELDLGGSNNLSDMFLLDFIGAMPLTDLHLGTQNNFSNAGLQALRGMQLKSLRLGSGKNITDSGLEVLKGLPLSKLDLGGRMEITNAGLTALKGLPLTELSLEGCGGLSGPGLEALRGLPLTTLNIGCTNVGDEDLDPLRGDMPLKRLNLNGTWVCDATDLDAGTMGALRLTKTAIPRFALAAIFGVFGVPLCVVPYSSDA